MMLPSKIIATVLGFTFLLLLTPFSIAAIAFVALVALAVAFFFLIQEVTKKLVHKVFYCPIKKQTVELELEPGIFKDRPYSDVVSCSYFNGKIKCGKYCLKLPQLQNLT